MLSPAAPGQPWLGREIELHTLQDFNAFCNYHLNKQSPEAPPGGADAEAIMSGDGFLQTPPHLGNQYTEDSFLRSVLRRLLPPETLAEVAPDLGEGGPHPPHPPLVAAAGQPPT